MCPTEFPSDHSQENPEDPRSTHHIDYGDKLPPLGIMPTGQFCDYVHFEAGDVRMEIVPIIDGESPVTSLVDRQAGEIRRVYRHLATGAYLLTARKLEKRGKGILQVEVRAEYTDERSAIEAAK